MTNLSQLKAWYSALIFKAEICIVYSRVKEVIITICFFKTISTLMATVFGSTSGWGHNRREGILSLLPIFQERWSIFRCCIYSLSARLPGSMWGQPALSVGRLSLGIVEVAGGIGHCSFSIAFGKEKKCTFPSALLILFRGYWGCSKKSVLRFIMERQYQSRSQGRVSWAIRFHACVYGGRRKQAENVYWFWVVSILAK